MGIRLVVVALVLSALVVVQRAQPDPAGAFETAFGEQTVFAGLQQPTNVEFAPDGRVFVAELSGRIVVFDSLQDQTPTLVKDLTAETHVFHDRGLLAIELDPNFATNGFLFALHTYDRDPPGLDYPEAPAPRWAAGQVECAPAHEQCLVSGRLLRLTIPPPGGQLPVPGAGTTVLWNWCEPAYSHTVGDMEFGPDGMLYVSHGDAAWPDYANYGNSQGSRPKNPCADPNTNQVGVAPTLPDAAGGMLRAQDARTPSDPHSLDGTVIRINPATGVGAPGNPGVPSAQPDDQNAKRIVAYGFRNPFRITLRPGTNDLYIGDVGRQAWEEINRVPNAADLPDKPVNFGWPCYEGGSSGSVKSGFFDDLGAKICDDLYADGQDPATRPLFAYRHGDKTVAGGDCGTGQMENGQAAIGGLEFIEGSERYGEEYDGALVFSDYARGCIFALRAGAGGVPNPAQPVEILAADTPVDLELGPDGFLYYVDIFVDGAVKRIVRNLPTASVTASPTFGPTPLAVTFDASGSTHPGTSGLTFDWDLDGTSGFEISNGGAVRNKTYSTKDEIVARVRVTDTNGSSNIATVSVFPGHRAPVITIESPSPGLRWSVGDTIQFSASATDPDEGVLGPGRFDWTVFLQHCPDGTNCHRHPVSTLAGTRTGSTVGPDHEMTARLELAVKVTDNVGLTAEKTLVLNPRTVQLSLHSAPEGAQLTLHGKTHAAPYSEAVIAGSTNSLTAPATGPGGLPFVGWSDGGGRSHTVSPTANTSLTATYRRPAPPPTSPPGPSTSGYWLLEEDGDVTAYGNAPVLAGVKDDLRGARAVAIAAHPGGKGFWVLLSDGRVIARGAAPAVGNASVAQLTKPGEQVATMSATPSGTGVWVFSSAGRVMALGNALPASQMRGTDAILALTLDGPIIDSVATPSGKGAYMVASDGGVFTLGDAVFIDSVRGQLTKLFGPPGLPDLPVVGIVPDPDGGGYWMVAADGGVFSFRAPFRGSLPAIVPFDQLFAPVNGMVPYGNGYLLVAGDGGVFTFSNLPFEGSGSGQVDSPVIGIAAVG